MITDALKGSIAVVTGGARGLGAATCRALHAQGASVAVLDQRAELAERLADELGSATGTARAYVCDLSAELSVSRTIDEIRSQHGGLDILVNNAGVDVTRPVTELTVAEWDYVVNVNLRAPFVTSRSVLPGMIEQGHGHIVNVTSTAAKRAWPNAAAYHATKWGLLGFSHALHTEARPSGVKVTAIVSGGMRTPFLLDRFPGIDVEMLQDPANVADTIVFVLMQPEGTVIPEVMVLPMREVSWP